MKKHMSLSIQIVILCITIVIVISIILSLLFISSINRITEKNIRSTAEITMKYIEKDIQYALAKSFDMTNIAASFMGSIKSVDLAKNILTDMLKTNPDAFEFYYGTVISRYEKEGFFVAATGWNPAPPWDQIKRPWFIEGINNPGKTVITDPYVDAQTGKICITVVKTANNEEGKIAGVVGADIFLDVLTNIVVSRKISADGQSFIVDASGLYLVHPNADFVLKKNFFDDSGLSLKKEDILSKETKILFQDNQYVCSVSLPGTSWFLVLTGPLSSFYSDLKSITKIVLITVIFLIIISAVAAILLSKFTTYPFKRLVVSFDVISKGDLTAVQPDYSIKEASLLSRGFNNLADGISDLVKKIKHSSSAIEVIANNLFSSVSGMRGTISEVREAVGSISEDIVKENDSINGTETSINQVVNEINNLNEKIKEQGMQISGASSAIEEMVASIRSIENNTLSVNNHVVELVRSSEEEKSRLSNTAEAIRIVETESMALAEMNDVISNVATQTNMLAMNAEIEAAHAGEFGKGFSVVAGEIRKLAETTAEQSKNSGEALLSIQKQIKDISDSAAHVEQSFDSMIQMIKQIEQIVDVLKNSTVEQGIGSKQILESISAINSISSAVQNGSLTMMQSTDVAAAACKLLIKLSNDVNAKLRKCEEGVTSLTEGSDAVSNVVEQAKADVRALNDSIRIFKTR